MAYQKKTWENLPSTNTPLNGTGLNDWENRIDGIPEVPNLVPLNDNLKSSYYFGKDCDALIDDLYIGYGNNMTNIPANTGNGYFVNIPHPTDGDKYNKQFYFWRTGDTIHTRNMENGTWGPWKLISATDTEWITATLGSNFEVYSSAYSMRYRKIGNVVYIQGAVKPKTNITTSAATADRTIFTLPSQYRPAENMVFICKGADKNIYNLAINPNTGQVYAGQYGTSSATTIPAGTLLMVYVSFVLG